MILELNVEAISDVDWNVAEEDKFEVRHMQDTVDEKNFQIVLGESNFCDLQF